MTTQSGKLHLATALTAFGLTTSLAASAQETMLEEVVVTAQKRAQSVQDLGMSIVAISGEEMREKGIDSVEDAIAHIPGTGFYDPTGGGVPIVLVRGVGLQNFRINDTPTTAVYVDDVYQTSVAMSSTALFDVDRLELLKGPQGGLYGRNAVGGALQVITRQPEFDAREGYILGGYGRYDRVELEAGSNFQVSDNAAIRLSGRVLNSDETQYHSVTGDFDHGAADQWGVRAQLRIATDNSDWNLKIENGEDNSDNPLLRAVAIWEPDPLGLGAPLVPGGNIADGAVLNVGGEGPGAYAVCSGILQGIREPGRCEMVDGITPDAVGLNGPYDSASNFKPRLENDWLMVTLRGRVDWGDYSFDSITAYTDFEHGRTVDYDAVDTLQQHIDYQSEITSWSQEFRLSHDTGDALSWIIGATYGEDELDENTLLEGVTGLLPIALGGLTQGEQPYVQKTEAWAVYGHMEYRFTDQWNLILEARYTDEDKSLTGGTILPELIDLGLPPELAVTDDSSNYSAATGKIVLEYTTASDILLYGSIARGFKSGGYFGGFATDPNQLLPFDEEIIVAYELGFKSDWPEVGARLNAAVFHYDRQDMQASGNSPSNIVDIQQLTNIGDAEVQGAELEGSWAATDSFMISGSAAWIESEVVDSDVVTSDVFSITDSASFEGAELANQPGFSASLQADYTIELNNYEVGLQAEYLYRSDQDLRMIVIPEERGLLEEDAYGLLNLSLSFRPADERYSVIAYINNATDEQYRTSATKDDLGGIYEVWGNPQIWGLRVDFAF